MPQYRPPLPAHVDLVEPHFTLAVAAAIIPMPLNGLYQYLHQHKTEYPRRYRRINNHPRKHRMITASEIRRIQDSLTDTTYGNKTKQKRKAEE